MRALMIGLALATMLIGSAAAERRCGWIVNPTPGNWWLTDRQGQWIMAVQGGREARGMDLLPDFSEREWVRTGGSSYGYGCACLDVRTRSGAITRILSVRQLTLRKCRADARLPRPE